MQKKYKVLIGVAVSLVAIRLILPYVVLHYANKSLAEMDGYYGHIDDIDLSIYRGAYTINDIYLNKVDSTTQKETDFFKANNIDLSIEWAAIFDGAIVGELEFDSPVLIFTKDRVELSDVIEDTSDFRKLLKGFMPLTINRFEVTNGSLHYVDRTSTPKVDVSLRHAHILALNLSNATNDKIELPSTVTANASVYEGTLTAKMKLNAMNEHSTFDLNAEIKNTNLVLLNDFLKAYGNFDVNKGSFSMYTEIASKNGKFKGYVKPIIKNLDVVGPEDSNDNLFNRIYEHVIGASGVILRNQRKQQVATKIELSGSFDNPQSSTIDALWQVLRNAFIQALMPSIDHEINLKSVDAVKPEDERGFFQRLFNLGDNDKAKKKK